MCFNAFAQISRPPETFIQKWFFWPSGVLKYVFWCICAYFQNTSNFFSKKIFLTVRSVLMHFPHTSRPPETFFQKRYFLLSGVVKNVFWCICTCLQTTRNFFFQKRYFWTSGVLKNVFACICAHFQTTRNISSKMIFLTFRSV